MRAIVITAIISISIIGCSTSETFLDPYPKPYVKIESDIKKPDWTKSSKIFWFDQSNQGFWAIGVAESNDPDLAFASSKATAAKNIAEFIQAQVSSEFKVKKGAQPDAQLLVEMITEKIKLSIVTVEYFTEKYLEYGRPKYVSYTKNFISQNSLKYAIDDLLQNIR